MLDLTGWAGLTALPQDLKNVKKLFLTGCTGLTALPQDLKNVEYLDLRDCTGLTALPQDLKNVKVLDLNGCTGLTTFTGSKKRENARSRDCTSLGNGGTIGIHIREILEDERHQHITLLP